MRARRWLLCSTSVSVAGVGSDPNLSGSVT